MDAFLHDIGWAVALRHDWLTPVFLGFAWLGYTTFFLISLPAAYWTWDKNKVTRVALIVLASALLNALLKDIWQNPRPDPSLWIDPYIGDHPSYGLPSGHTQVGIVMWFWIAYESKKRWAWIAATVIAIGGSFSRLYLGVHDVEDVLGGAGIGFATLLLYHWTFTSQFVWWRKLPFLARFAVLTAVFTITIILWPGGAGSNAAIAGFFLAWYLGAELDRDTIRYAPGPGWWRRVVAAVFGVIGVIWLFRGLSALQEAAGETDVLLAAINGLIVSSAVVLLFPMIFQLFLLAQREPR